MHHRGSGHHLGGGVDAEVRVWVDRATQRAVLHAISLGVDLSAPDGDGQGRTRRAVLTHLGSHAGVDGGIGVALLNRVELRHFVGGRRGESCCNPLRVPVAICQDSQWLEGDLRPRLQCSWCVGSDRSDTHGCRTRAGGGKCEADRQRRHPREARPRRHELPSPCWFRRASWPHRRCRCTPNWAALIAERWHNWRSIESLAVVSRNSTASVGCGVRTRSPTAVPAR